MPRLLRTALLAVVLAPLAAAQPVPCADGSADEYTCENVDLLARLPLNATPEFSESSSDIWGWTDPVTGIEYAIINQYDHTAFVDLSDPAAPFVVGTLAAPSEAVARDAKTYADHALIGTDNGGAPLQVFDLTRLRDVESPPATFTADAEYTAATGPHNLALDPESGFAYLVAIDSEVCAGSMHIVDVRTPTAPTYAGCFGAPGEIFHDAQCVTYDGPDADYAGRELCFGSAPGSGTLTIVDVTDKAAPELIIEAPYPNPAYTHQGWLTDDGRYFLLNDEFDEAQFGINSRTVVFDVEDLDDPTVAFEHFGEAGSTDHNLFVHDGYVYQANYTSGLRILDLANIDDGSLSEAAFFDTHPEDDATGFDGAFGVYPYFESGIVVVSDMARGLFVLQPRLGPTTDAAPAQLSGAATLEVYPNPNNGRTAVALTVPSAQTVEVVVYDVLGRRIAEVFAGSLAASETHRFTFDTAGVPGGSYVVRAEGETFEIARQLTVAR
jgi:choice-of-anchor B domain-containing protein